VLDAGGEVALRRSVAMTKRSIKAFFRSYAAARVVVEAGTQSRWVSELLTSLGCSVVVANPRQVRLIGRGNHKNDKRDAETLARLGRADPKLLAPVQHRGEAAQRDLVWIRARDVLVRSRTSAVSCARGLLKTFGLRVAKCSTDAFARRAREVVSEELAPALEPLLVSIETLTAQIKLSDRGIAELAQRYPETARMQEIQGVGDLTSLAFVLTLEEHERFKHSRDVGPYLGLTPRQRQSGSSDPQLRISKAGDAYLRRLLVGSAQYILGKFGPDTDLRRYGLKLEARGGKRAKKVAVVAVARKLGVLMHRLWASGESYVPVGYTARMAA
jgi:transposase